MNKRYSILISLVILSMSMARSATTEQPMPFAKAEIRQVVNEVSIIYRDSLEKLVAQVEQTLQAPDILETGRRSRAELIAEDGTITRVGSNTLFSFEPTKRQINLEKGSVLFHSPKGKGGGQIISNAATASVVGTTIIVAATTDGGFKILCLEGQAKITFANGATLTLNPGQMSFVLPTTDKAGSSSGKPGQVLNFDLDKMLADSALVHGFDDELPSQALIDAAMQAQQMAIENGNLTETETVILGLSNDGQNIILTDGTTIENAINASQQMNEASGLDASNALQQRISITNQASVPTENLFLEFASITAAQSDFLSSSPFGNEYTGILAKSVEFTTDTIELSLPNNFTNSGQFDLAADEYLLFAQETISFTGLEGISVLKLTAPLLDFNPSVTPRNGAPFIEIDTDHQVTLQIETSGEVAIVDGSINNNFGPIDVLVRDGDIIFSDFVLSTSGTGGVTAPGPTAPKDIGVTTDGNISVYSSNIDAGTSTIHVGSLPALSNAPTPYEILMQNTDFMSDKIYITALQSVTASGNGSNGAFQSNLLNIQAANLIDLNNVNLSQVSSVYLAATTINLQNINFKANSTVQLRSQEGLVNFANGQLTGYINFDQTVTYGGNQAINFVPITQIFNGAPTGYAFDSSGDFTVGPTVNLNVVSIGN